MPDNTSTGRESKFTKIIEEAMSRYKGTNLLVGDRVQFIKNFMQHEWMKNQPAVKIDRIKVMIESGNNIRVSAIKAIRPATAQTGHFEDVDGFYVDIVSEPAPGLFTQTFTVPQELLEYIDDGINLAGETPDNQIRKDTSQIKPTEVTSKKSVTVDQTNSDKRNLPTTNVVIPSSAPPKQYTAKYL